MRSDQIHVAIAQGNNRFEICQLTSKGVRVMHKPGIRTEDTINKVLTMLRRAVPSPAVVTSLGCDFGRREDRMSIDSQDLLALASAPLAATS